MVEETKKEDTAPMQDGTVSTPQAEAPSLTVADLRNIRTIIDISSQRGAFKGVELKTVGEVFEKLDVFLKAVDAKAKAEETANTDSPAEVKTEEK
jgi:hypothetical protein|tara:strand:+ start:8680 stop:8964 length:285 start_codon:yes stop_codon:yes gene_type:complete